MNLVRGDVAWSREAVESERSHYILKIKQDFLINNRKREVKDDSSIFSLS